MPDPGLLAEIDRLRTEIEAVLSERDAIDRARLEERRRHSQVRAGMIAELYGGTMTQAGSTWEVMILRPGGSPIENLARAFVDAQLYPIILSYEVVSDS